MGNPGFRRIARRFKQSEFAGLGRSGTPQAFPRAVFAVLFMPSTAPGEWQRTVGLQHLGHLHQGWIFERSARRRLRLRHFLAPVGERQSRNRRNSCISRQASTARRFGLTSCSSFGTGCSLRFSRHFSSSQREFLGTGCRPRACSAFAPAARTLSMALPSFRSLLKRAHKGTFRNLSPKHLDGYAQELAGRHTRRERDTIEMMRSMRDGMDGKRLAHKALVAPNGRPSGARA